MTDMSAFFIMTFVIVGIISCCIVLSLALRAWFFNRRNHKRRGRFIDWVDGHALILSMQRTGKYKDAMPEVKLRLQVQSCCGNDFNAEVCSALSFSEILRIREGGKVPVRFNRGNHSEINISRSSTTGAITIHSPISTFRNAKSSVR